MTAAPHRILFLLKRLDLNDGVSSHLDTLCGELAARGHTAMILSGPVTGQGAMADRLQRLRSATERLEIAPSYSLVRSLLPAGLKAVKAFKPTVIHAHGSAAATIGKLLSIVSGAPLVTTTHVLVDDRSRAQTLKAGMVARMVSVDRAIAISSSMRAYFVETLGIDPARIDLVPNGIQAERFFPPSAAERVAARATFGVPPGALVCVLPGRMDRTKGHDLAIDAVRRLAPRRPLVCLFSGTGDDAAEIMRHALAADDNRERFRFLGQLPTLATVFHASDVMLLPSRNEGFPLVVVEAMLSGCVPVRTPSSGASDQVEDGVSGFIVPFDDAAALADRIERLFDEPLRSRMAAAAHARARAEFTSDIMADRTVRSYDKAVEGRVAR